MHLEELGLHHLADMEPGLEELLFDHLVGLEAGREAVAQFVAGVSGLVHGRFLDREVVAGVGTVS